jgi:flagella basal body P-ring formation protein FlgA
MRRVRSDSLRGETPVDATKAWEASTTLALGQPVTTLRVRPVPDRREGDGVTLVVERGPVRISAPGTLLGDAFVGQSVAVTNEVTHAVVHGQFLDDGLVHVGGTR